MSHSEAMTENIYLDNAATSHPKPETVYQRTLEALRRGGNAGRGDHDASLTADRLIFAAREALADFFSVADSSCFVFTLNATTALNTALFGLLKPGERVVTSSMEHNAVTRPLRRLVDLGVKVDKVYADAAGLLDQRKLRQACLAQPTRMLVLNHCSNVNGQLQDIDGLGAFCREHNILFLLDGSQSAGSFPLAIESELIDLYAAPGHKNLLGPAGTGLLYVRPDLKLKPLTYGGTGGNSHSDLQPEMMPERLESGTQNLAGIAGLLAAVEYLQQEGLTPLREKVEAHLQRLIDGLTAIEGVRLYAADRLSRQGDALSFTIDRVDPAEIGFRLDHEFGISVRVGLHCAPDAHRTLGTYPQGTVRVSPGVFTNEQEIEKLLAAIGTICADRVDS
jgi:cysteine desulfurase family protein